MDMIKVSERCGHPMTFRVNYDDMPDGFLDGLQKSDFVRLCNHGQAFAEVGQPVVDNHVDPRIALMRVRQIYTERVCAHLRVMNHDADGFVVIMEEAGPHAHFIRHLLTTNNLYVQPRFLYDVDGNYSTVITFDVVEKN